MPILVAIVCFAMTACVMIQSGPSPSAPLPKPSVYEWVALARHPRCKAWLRTKRPAFMRLSKRNPGVKPTAGKPT